jgi:hypothetical protein
MDAPDPGLGPVGAGAGRIPRRTARAPGPPTAKLHPRGGLSARRGIITAEISDVPTAAISCLDGVGYAAFPAGGHTRTHHPNMFANNGGDALTGDQAMTRAGSQQHRSLRDTTHHRPMMCAHTAADRGTTQWAVRDVIAPPRGRRSPTGPGW